MARLLIEDLNRTCGELTRVSEEVRNDSLSLYPSLSLSAPPLAGCPSVCQSAAGCLSVYLSVCLSINPFLSVCLSASLFLSICRNMSLYAFTSWSLLLFSLSMFLSASLWHSDSTCPSPMFPSDMTLTWMSSCQPQLAPAAAVQATVLVDELDRLAQTLQGRPANEAAAARQIPLASACVMPRYACVCHGV